MKRMFDVGTEEKVLNKCPLCGAALEYHALNQYSNVYSILKNGTLSTRRKKRVDVGTMECGFIICTECNFHTNCDLEVEDYKGIYIHQNGDQYVYEMDNEE